MVVCDIKPGMVRVPGMLFMNKTLNFLGAVWARTWGRGKLSCGSIFKSGTNRHFLTPMPYLEDFLN